MVGTKNMFHSGKLMLFLLLLFFLAYGAVFFFTSYAIVIVVEPVRVRAAHLKVVFIDIAAV
jgi:hypothetical protein